MQILKLAISFAVFKFQVWKDPSIRKSFSFKEIMLWSVPALLYAIGHNVYYYILSIIDTPITVQVFGSLETVIVGVFSVVVLKKRWENSGIISFQDSPGFIGLPCF